MSSFRIPVDRARLSRRMVLRGAGVALALPWLESLVRPASAQVPLKPNRFVAIFLPNGAPSIWTPPTAGAGPALNLSSVLEPLADLKSKTTVISGLENGSAFNASGSSSVEPSNNRLPAGWLTCTDAASVRKRLGLLSNADANGISVDQVMAAHAAFAGMTALPSLQIGLSSEQSSCDIGPCSATRSVSWKTETTPLYKTVDPTLFFDQLMGVWPGGPTQPLPRRDARKSLLDAVQASAAIARARLSTSDKQRMDEFLTSVRSVEKRVVDSAGAACAMPPSKPSFPSVDGVSFAQNMAGYDRSVHFDLMNELLALALQCDRTRVVSYMLEDERNDFLFDFVPKRDFGELTSTPSTGVCPSWYSGGLNGDPNHYASIVHWHVGKVAALCKRLDGMIEADGQSVLDNCVVYLGASMHGADHAADRLPVFTVGSGGGALKTNQHVTLSKRPLRDFYFTLMNDVYKMGVQSFGDNLTGAPIARIPELLA
jgi:hypothetical protein